MIIDDIISYHASCRVESFPPDQPTSRQTFSSTGYHRDNLCRSSTPKREVRKYQSAVYSAALKGAADVRTARLQTTRVGASLGKHSDRKLRLIPKIDGEKHGGTTQG
jgi:hypothetical protein